MYQIFEIAFQVIDQMTVTMHLDCCAETTPRPCDCPEARHHHRDHICTKGRGAVVRGINRGLNYMTQWPLRP
jgi:hypothetical protein